MNNAWDTDYRDPDELAAPWLADRPAPLDPVEALLLRVDWACRTDPDIDPAWWGLALLSALGMWALLWRIVEAVRR